MQRTVYTAQAVLSGLFPAEAAAGTMRAELSLNTSGDWADEFLSYNEVASYEGLLMRLSLQGLSLQGLSLSRDSQGGTCQVLLIGDVLS